MAFLALLAGGPPPPDRAFWLGAMLGCQQLAISVHNDWCDRDLDAATKPWRAIPSGAVGAPIARGVAWILAGASILLASPLGLDEAALNVAGLTAGFAYNAWLKRTLLSWLPFAAAFPLLPHFGAAALDRPMPLGWTLHLVGLPAVLAIHLADTLPDVAGDTRAGISGLAHRLGARRTRQVSLLAASVAALAATGGGLAQESAIALAGGASALAGVALAVLRPAWHRATVTGAAAAAAIGWVGLVSGAGGP